MRTMRKLSENFIDDLVNESGLLYSILEQIKQDHTLMLAIRKDYINVYYSGGNLLRIKDQRENTYQFHFDQNYNITKKDLPDLPTKIKNYETVTKWANVFPLLKVVMDNWFAAHPKLERKIQQLIVCENNNPTNAEKSEYLISDIEFADAELGARFDMLAIRQPDKAGGKHRAALVEVKYGDRALGGAAGMIKHLRDMDKLICDKSRYATVLETMTSQLKQLDQLGLLVSSSGSQVELNPNDKPEVIFVLANHNPRNPKLASILSEPEILEYGDSERFDLKFFVASFAGYGLDSHCMLDLHEFQKLLEQ